MLGSGMGVATLGISERDVEATRIYNFRININDDSVAGAGAGDGSDDEVRACVDVRSWLVGPAHSVGMLPGRGG